MEQQLSELKRQVTELVAVRDRQVADSRKISYILFALIVVYAGVGMAITVIDYVGHKPTSPIAVALLTGANVLAMASAIAALFRNGRTVG